MGFLKNLFTKNLSIEEAVRNSRYLQSLYSYIGLNAPVMSFQNLNQLIEEGFKRNADAFSVINWVAENAANIPQRVERFNGEKWIADPLHDLQKLLNKPNPYQSGLEYKHQVYGFYSTTGNAFTYAPRIEEGVNKGQTLEMWIMPSQHTEIYSGGWKNPVTGYGLNLSGSQNEKFDYSEVLHMKSLQLDFGNGRELWGMSPLQAGLLALDRSNSNYIAAANSFKNMGMAGILSVESEPLEPNLTDEQRKQAERGLKDDYNGVFNNGKTMVTNGDVTYTKLGLSPVDLNLLADKKATLRDICNIYKVSSILFNDNENSTYNNVGEAKKSAYNDCIIPLVNRYTEELNTWLVPSYGDNIRIVADYSDVAVLQGDKAEQSKWLTEQVNSGQMTRNESRIEQGLEPLDMDVMNKPTVTMGTTPIEDIAFDIGQEGAAAAKAMGKHYLDK